MRSPQSPVWALALVLIPLILPGCAVFEISKTESAWQAMHLVDVVQTLNGPASDPCYTEGTWTRHLIGEKPDPAAVLAWGVGMAVLHAAADRWLQRAELHPAVEWTLRSVDLGYKGAIVASNHAMGIRPFGENECPWR